MICRVTILRFCKLIEPPPRLKISEWSERNAYLPAEGNAEGGKFRLARMPWQRDMLDDPIDPHITETAWMLASQLGKTMCIVLIIEYFAAYKPTKILICYPKLDDVKDFINDKLMPATHDTPAMYGVIKDPRTKGSNSRALNRKFPGGGLVGVGSISTSSLRRVSARVVIQDEIDDFEITPQGDSMALADKRATTFHNAVLLKSSTPTAKDESRIEAKFESGDQQRFFVPCPKCGHMQHLQHANFKFSFGKEEYERFRTPIQQEAVNEPNPKQPCLAGDNESFRGARNAGASFGASEGENEGGAHNAGRRNENGGIGRPIDPKQFQWDINARDIRDTEKAMFVCESETCKAGWSDQDRIAAINSGDPENPPIVVNGKEYRAKWVAKFPGRRIRSRHMNGYYRLIGRKDAFKSYHHEFAEDFLTALAGGRETHMVWVNTFLAETWADDFEQLDWHPLAERTEDYKATDLPVEIMFIIAGCDVHPDRVEIQVIGWGAAEETWVIEHKVVWGDFTQPEMQDRVWDFLDKRYTHPVLGEMKINASGFDTGKQTKVKEVYRFCKKHRSRNVFALKGGSDPLAPIYSASDVTARFGIKLFLLNTDLLKCTIFDRITTMVDKEEPKTDGPRVIHFPKTCDTKYFRQLCSEKRVAEKRGNNTVYIWKKHKSNTRNEVLDTKVYAFGVYEIVKQDGWIERKWAEVQKKLKESEPTPERAIPANVEQVSPIPRLEPPKNSKPPQKPKPKPPPFRGGFFNPLGL